MSYPFGGHPRFEDYCVWAVEQGCSCTSGFSKLNGKQETFTLLENPANGKHTVECIPGKEFLAPTKVGALDRRLGLDSPFPKRDIPDFG